VISSLSRGLLALTIMAQADRPLGVSELAERLEIDPSSSYRILATLEKHGFAVQQARGRKYALGFASLMLADSVLRQLDVAAQAGPHLRALVEQTGESAHLAVLNGAFAVFVCRETAAAFLRVETAIGTSEPAHCTAAGKALLFDHGERDLRALYPDGTLDRYTEQTIGSVDELIDELARTRARGYAYDDEELHSGVRCLAAAVRGHHGKIVASIGVSGPTARLTRERLSGLASTVREAAAALSAEMGATNENLTAAPEYAAG
jgi:IclR family transcriptional regulator, KDG regulon repressor